VFRWAFLRAFRVFRMAKKPPLPPTEPPALPPLVDLLEAEDELPAVSPAGAGVFDFDLDSLAKKKAAGHDVEPAFWQVEKWINGKRTSIDRAFTPSQATLRFLGDTLGAGTYLCVMKNARGQAIARNTRTVDGPEHPPTETGRTLGGGTLAENGAPRSGSMLDRVLEVMLLRALDPPKTETREDPMRDAMATMVKGMALQQQMQAQALQLQMQMQDRRDAPGNRDSDRLFGLLEKLANGSKGPNGTSTGNALAELMPILTLGLNLGSRMAGGAAGAPAEKKNEWLEIIPDLADSVGVPLIVALSQTLPADKAREALRAIEEHMRARQAEAEASKHTTPIDVPGTGTEIP